MNKVHLTDSDKKMITEAGHYLSNNLDKRITIPQLADMMCMSEKKLKSGFMDVWGIGVHTYFTERRMEKIKELLQLNQPLKAIAHSTAYKHKNALIKAFRQKFGVSPAVWKRHCEQINGAIILLLK